MTRRDAFFAAVLCLLLLCSSGLQASPVIGPPIERNGLRIEPWLASPKIAIPSKTVGYKSCIPTVLFSVRVTNLTSSCIRFDQYAVGLTLMQANGKEIVADPIMIAGYLRQAQEQDFLVLQPGQSIVLPEPSRLYWSENSLCLSWLGPFAGHPWVYESLVPGTYRVKLRCDMPASTMAIRDDRTSKIIKTLNGFWTGDVTTVPLTFELTQSKP